MSKIYAVKVYDINDVYLSTWKDVVSNINFNNEINNAGGELKLTLARNAGDYGEGTDVDFNHKVKVYCYDKELPNGQIIFQGTISGYTPIYSDNNVEVTVLSYGQELNNFIIEGGESLLYSKTGGTSSWLYGNAGSPNGFYGVGLKITAQNTEKWTRMEFNLCKGAYFASGGSPFTYIKIATGTSVTNAFTNANNNPLATATYTFPSGEATGVYSFRSFLLDKTIDVTSGTTYYIFIAADGFPGSDKWTNNIQVATSGGPAYSTFIYGMGGPSGALYSADWYEYSPYVPDYKIYTSSGNTKYAFSSYDPSNIMKALIDDYSNRGGSLTYTPTSIDLTGTSVSYTFNVNTTLEGIQKCLDLAPENWYWYINYADNTINFKEKSTSVDHTFTLEKDLANAKFEKRTEDIINTIYFTGGDTGGGVNFYKKYTDANSIALYGTKSIKLSDQRITTSGPADAICNSILATKSQPELRVELDIIDSNNDMNMGYDIESIQIGDVIGVRNVTQQVGLSTWDVARWDESYWDFNIYNLSSLYIQVIKINYREDSVKIYGSTIAVDVNKRVEQINRTLEQTLVADNPNSPT